MVENYLSCVIGTWVSLHNITVYFCKSLKISLIKLFKKSENQPQKLWKLAVKELPVLASPAPLPLSEI